MPFERTYIIHDCKGRELSIFEGYNGFFCNGPRRSSRRQVQVLYSNKRAKANHKFTTTWKMKVQEPTNLDVSEDKGEDEVNVTKADHIIFRP